MARLTARANVPQILEFAASRCWTRQRLLEEVARVRIRHQAEKDGWTLDELALKLCTRPSELADSRTFERVMGGVDPVGLDILCLFSEALKVPLHDVVDPDDWPAVTGGTGAVVPTPVAAQARPSGDLKNVINDKTISERLLKRRSLPSLAECVRATAMQFPAQDAHKDQAVLANVPYNHFFQLSAVLCLALCDREQPVWLGYARNPKPGGLQYVNRQGLAMLWGASFWYSQGSYRAMKHPDSYPMDMWMHIASHDPAQAQAQFLDPTFPLLARILEYKLDLGPWAKRVEPLGVVTNDLRKPDGTGRVYTQYVSLLAIVLNARGIDPAAFAASLGTDGHELFVIEPMDDPDIVFRDPKSGRKNIMDILAWNELQGRRQEQLESAALTPGFKVV